MRKGDVNKGGRPPKKIDEEMVEKLASIGCTVEEIASTLGCCRDTLHRRFSDILKKGHNTAKISLRRMQWKSAAMGNVTMQIWLGKNMLSQSNKHEIQTLDIQRIQVIHYGNSNACRWGEEDLKTESYQIA
jgi:hypothetical protein